MYHTTQHSISSNEVTPILSGYSDRFSKFRSQHKAVSHGAGAGARAGGAAGRRAGARGRAAGGARPARRAASAGGGPRAGGRSHYCTLSRLSSSHGPLSTYTRK